MSLLNALPQTQFPVKDWVTEKKLGGKALAEAVRQFVKRETVNLLVKPGLAVIIVGDDEADPADGRISFSAPLARARSRRATQPLPRQLRQL